MDTLWGTDILNIIDSSLAILCGDCIMYLNHPSLCFCRDTADAAANPFYFE